MSSRVSKNLGAHIPLMLKIIFSAFALFAGELKLLRSFVTVLRRLEVLAVKRQWLTLPASLLSLLSTLGPNV